MSTQAVPEQNAVLKRVIAHRSSLYASGSVPGGTRGSFATHPSGLSQGPGAVLRDLVVQERAATTIETGLALGLSALFIVEGLLTVGGDSPRHVAVDPYQDENWVRAGERTIRDAGAEAIVEIIEEDSTLALPRLVTEGRLFDLGFVDGGHNFEHAFLDLYFMQRLVRPGGLVVVDDVWMPAVRAAVGYAASNLGATRESHPDTENARRFAILRLPSTAPERAWDHFVPFWNA